jgi:hypothetical protein
MHRSNLPKKRDAKRQPWIAWSFFSAVIASGNGKLRGCFSRKMKLRGSDLPSEDCFRSGGAKGRLFSVKTSARSPSTATHALGKAVRRADRGDCCGASSGSRSDRFAHLFSRLNLHTIDEAPEVEAEERGARRFRELCSSAWSKQVACGVVRLLKSVESLKRQN